RRRPHRLPELRHLVRPHRGGVMKVSHDGVHWSGTFGVVLDAFLDDLLSDEPIEVRVTCIGKGDEEDERIGTIVSHDDATVLLADGDIPKELILSVEIT